MNFISNNGKILNLLIKRINKVIYRIKFNGKLLGTVAKISKNKWTSVPYENYPVYGFATRHDAIEYIIATKGYNEK